MFLLALFQLSDSADNIHCKEKLSKYEPLDDAAISKWLLSIIGTHSAHNIDVIVDTVHELVSS
jgi:hypothetical protein